jgi:bifunctional enzyme CysN/CysC
MSVSICLEDELDISRGDVLVHEDSQTHLARTFDAMMVWMAETPLDPAKSYLIKHTARYVRAGFHEVKWRLNMDTLAEEQSTSLALNEIGRVQVTAHQALVFDAYADNRGAGCFVVVDSLTNNTVAAGMIVAPDQEAGEVEENDRLIGGLKSGVSTLEREEQMGQRGTTLWISGIDGEEKTHFVYALERRLFDQGTVVHVMNPLDPENAAYGVPLSNALEMANICNHAGLVTLFSVPHAAETAIESARDRMTGSTLIHVELGVAVSSGANVALDVNGVGEQESIERLVSYLTEQGLLHKVERRN